MNIQAILANSLKIFIAILLVRLLLEPMTSRGEFGDNVNAAISKLTDPIMILLLIGVSLVVGVIYTYYRLRRGR